jgi:inner membrane transporter RhtA
VTESRWQTAAAEYGRRIPAPLILIVALTTMQLSSGTAKLIMTVENANGLAFLRLAIGTALLWLVIRPPVKGLSQKQWMDALLLGVVYAVLTVTFYLALTHLPLGLAVTIGFLGPLMVSVTGARQWLDFVWPVLGFAGLILLVPSSEDTDLPLVSLGYGLAYAASWFAYILTSARAGRSMRGLDGFVLASAVATVIIAPLGLPHAAVFLATPELLMMTLLVTILITVPFGLEFIALKRIEPRVFGVLLSMEPAIAAVVGIVMLGEILPTSGWLAILAITVASIGATTAKTDR